MNKLTPSQVNDNISPFDSIKHIDENGNEFWYARELQVVLGYVKWQHFHKNIKRALLTCKNAGNPIDSNFLPRSVKSNGGRDLDDWKLSRYACYLTAMNGDPAKPEIAQAQSYFAVKTREAEVVIPQQNDRIRELELELQLAQAKTQQSLAEKAVLDTRHLIVSTCPEPVQQKILGYEKVTETVEKEVVVDKRTGERYDGVGIGYIKARYGFKTNKEAWAFMESIGCGKDSQYWSTQLSAVAHSKFDRSMLDYVDEVYYQSDRQMWLGE